MSNPIKLSSSIDAMIEDIRGRSRSSIYKRDFAAWKADVLGVRTYQKMGEIMDDALFGKKTRTAIKSANGCGKSAEISFAMMWHVTVHPPEEVLAIASAPSVSQIARVLFRYAKEWYGVAASRGFALPGEINEALEWKYQLPGGGKGLLAFGKRPADSDAVSHFQGTRALRTLVLLDEFGGLPQDLVTAAEAIITGSYSRLIGIGNPDRRGTEMYRIFTEDKYESDWGRHTISAFDLPTFTGEVVYPDNPEMQERLLKGLTSPEWVDQKRRAWGEGSARWLATVLGEFPGEDDNTLYSQESIDRATDADIDPSDADGIYLGCDIARYGMDDTVIYSNHGGKIRLVDKWSKTDNITTARKIHEHALRVGATEVRVDAAGTGTGVFDALEVLDEFAKKTYTLIGVLGGSGSPDINRWMNARAWHHDQFREGMQSGRVDLSIDDSQLRDELISQTFKFTQRGAIQVTSKDEARKSGAKSPDHLDAAIYSYIDMTHLTGDHLRPGDKFSIDLDLYANDSIYSGSNSFFA